MKDSLLNLVPGYSGKTGCFVTIVDNVGDLEDSGSSSAIPSEIGLNAFIYRGIGLARFLDVSH